MANVFVNEEDKLLLKSLLSIKDRHRRQLAIGSVITKIFEYNKLPIPVVVGGTVVYLYSDGLYRSLDLDMKSDVVPEYKEIMKELGYTRIGKDFIHDELESYIEFPSGDREDSEEHMVKYIVEETGLPIYLIGFEDIILDRIKSYHATNDQESKEWALKLMGALYGHIDWSYLHKQANKLGILKVTEKIQRTVKRYPQLYKAMKDETSVTSENIGRMKLF
jgi:hypothetical protein